MGNRPADPYRSSARLLQKKHRRERENPKPRHDVQEWNTQTWHHWEDTSQWTGWNDGRQWTPPSRQWQQSREAENVHQTSTQTTAPSDTPSAAALLEAQPHVQLALQRLASLPPGEAGTILNFLASLPRPTQIPARPTITTGDKGVQTSPTVATCDRGVQTSPTLPAGLRLHRLHHPDQSETAIDDPVVQQPRTETDPWESDARPLPGMGQTRAAASTAAPQMTYESSQVPGPAVSAPSGQVGRTATASAARRSRTMEPRSGSDLLQATASTRTIKIRQLEDAQSAGKALQTAEHINDVIEFLDKGAFHQFHNPYHLAREGRAVRADGTPFAEPLMTPACGNWIWSLTASLVVGQVHLGGRQQHGRLGDAIEAYLYTVYCRETREAQSLVAAWSALASSLHSLLAGIPHTLYYRMSW